MAKTRDAAKVDPWALFTHAQLDRIGGPSMEPRNDVAATERLYAPPDYWLLVERWCERYPSEWRLVFKRGDDVLEISVDEEVWRAFDAH